MRNNTCRYVQGQRIHFFFFGRGGHNLPTKMSKSADCIKIDKNKKKDHQFFFPKLSTDF